MELTRVCTNLSSTLTKDSADFVLYKGITFRLTLTFKDADDTPLDLTGTTITFNMVKENGSPFLTIDTSGSTSNGSTILIASPPQSGEVQLIITDEETNLMEFQQGYWWFSLNLQNGDVIVRGKGKIFLKKPYES